jgi:predicted DNA-binding transcriptional regulator AlpA
MIEQALQPGDRLIDVRVVCDIVGAKSPSTVYKLIHRDGFPRAINIGHSARWIESEVRAYAGRKIAESRSRASTPRAAA